MPIVKEKEIYTPESIFESNSVSITRGETYNGLGDVKKILNEYFDITDNATRTGLLSMNEAEHNTILSKLTVKLYKHIVEKVDDINYGEIPGTKGDITKLTNYADVSDVISVMDGIIKEYKEDTRPIQTIAIAYENVKQRKDLFYRCFTTKTELGIMIYNNVVLAIYSAIGFMISSCIEFIKNPKEDSFTIVLDKVAYNKSKDHLLYDSLEKFNKACEKNKLDDVLNGLIKQKARNFAGAAAATILGVLGAAGIFVLLYNIIPICRQLVYYFYHTRVVLSDYCQNQADLLQMNAYNIERNNTIDQYERETIASKQNKIADRFRKVANKVMIDDKQAENHADKELSNTKNKFTVDDVEDEDETTVSALF